MRGGALSGRQGDSARAVQRRSLRQEAKDQHARNILNAEKRLADAKAAEKAARDQELSPLASLVPSRGARAHMRLGATGCGTLGWDVPSTALFAAAGRAGGNGRECWWVLKDQQYSGTLRRFRE